MPSLLRHGLGRGRVVAGQHDDADAGRLERGDRSRGRRLDRIGNGDDAGRLAVDGDEDGGGAFPAQLVGISSRPLVSMPASVMMPQIADHQLAPIDGARDAFADRRVEVLDRRERKAALVGRPHDGGGQRMLAAALEACGQAQQLVFLDAGARS